MPRPAPRSLLLPLLALLAAPAPSGAELFQLAVVPQPALAGEDLTLVVSGVASCPSFDPAELARGVVGVPFSPFGCLAPPVPFTTEIPLGALPEGEWVAQLVDRDSGAAGDRIEFEVGPSPLAPPVPCAPDHDTLCLRGGRFAVEATVDTPGLQRRARVRLLSYGSGALYFFESGNPELFVKVLDGCGFNGHHWLFVSGLTDLAVTLRVFRVASGEVRVVRNPQGRAFPSLQDIRAFGGCP